MSCPLLNDHASCRLQPRGSPEDVMPLLTGLDAYEHDKWGAKPIDLRHRDQCLRNNLGIGTKAA